MAPTEKDQLSKNDLFILMDSYKNNIQLNTTLLEQQKQMLQLHSNVLEKQNETMTMLDNLILKLGKCSETIGTNQTSLSTSLYNLPIASCSIIAAPKTANSNSLQ